MLLINANLYVVHPCLPPSIALPTSQGLLQSQSFPSRSQSRSVFLGFPGQPTSLTDSLGDLGATGQGLWL